MTSKCELSIKVSNRTAADPIVLSQWISNGVPSRTGCRLDLHLVDKGDDSSDGPEKSQIIPSLCPLMEKKIIGVDKHTGLKYAGDVSMVDGYKWFVGFKRGNEMVLEPAVIFDVKHDYERKEHRSTFASLTTKEKADDFNEKFGSKKTKRLLELKRKYTVHFDESDLNRIGNDVVNSGTSAHQDEEVRKIPAIDILPPQNMSAVSITEVYKLEDIISSAESDSVKSSDHFNDLETLLSNIKTDFVKRNLRMRAKDGDDMKLIAICLDIMIQIVSSKIHDLRRKDPLPDVSDYTLKLMFLDKYTTNVRDGTRFRRVIPDKFKDRLLIHCLILSLMMNNYKELESETICTAFKTTDKTMKRIAIATGCYIESRKNSAGLNSPAYVLKLPLNSIKEPAKKKRR